MTPIGHSLAGLSLAVLGAPLPRSLRAHALFAAAFVVLPNIPDAPIPGWGHDDYRVSHSLLVNAALAALLVRLLSLSARLWAAIGGARGALCGALAWQSHFLLDSFYNHGKGVAIYWPVSRARLVLTMPWFNTLPRWTLEWSTARIVLIEAGFYGTILLLAIAARGLEIRLRRSEPHHDA